MLFKAHFCSFYLKQHLFMSKTNWQNLHVIFNISDAPCHRMERGECFMPCARQLHPKLLNKQVLSLTWVSSFSFVPVVREVKYQWITYKKPVIVLDNSKLGISFFIIGPCLTLLFGVRDNGRLIKGFCCLRSVELRILIVVTKWQNNKNVEKTLCYYIMGIRIL